MGLRSYSLEIDQLLPSLAPRDAIGYHALKMQELIQSLGIKSEIYADEIKGELKGQAHLFAEFQRKSYRSNRYIIYQASTGSPIAGHLTTRREPILINYHNITPKEILGRWDIGVGIVVGAGIKQLSFLKERLVGAISVSQYNKWCLAQEGITKNSLVAAPFIPVEAHSGSSQFGSGIRTRSVGSNWLFVGRIAPNKAQHDVIKAFSAYVTGWQQEATLTLVGGISSKSYADSLRELVGELGISERVHFTGPVDSMELEKQYENATVFVCLSDHEGFGFPIIEALRHSVPVVAFASSAIPETLGTSGILVASKNPIQVAAAVALVENDTQLRKVLRIEAHNTLERYSQEAATLQNLNALRKLIPEMASRK